MKTKVLISLFFVLSVIVLYFSQPGAKETGEQKINTSAQSDSFLIGSPANGSYMDYAGYKKASMNLWHVYEGGGDWIGNKLYPAGWINIGAPHDRCLTDISQYVDEVKGILHTNAQNGLTSNMQRPKIEYLSYGQHSDYQAEVIPEDPVNNATDWFYSYRNHETGGDITDGQETPVRFCDVNNAEHQAGYVVKDLKSNRELCNEDDLRINTDHIYDWYFMPKIKIPQGLNNNTQVCKIEIYSWEGGNPIKTWELTAGNFKDTSGNYSGGYIDRFNLEGNGYKPMTILVSEELKFNPNKHHWTDVNNICHFDIRIYWYKQCNMWVDYIRVENEIAYDLFQGHHDDWIQQEAQQIGGYAAGAPHKFYIEEFEYNCFPCFKYVNEKIQQYQPNMSLMGVPYMSIPPMNGVWVSFGDEKIKNVYSYLGVKEIVTSPYPLHGEKYLYGNWQLHSYVPNTLPINHPYLLDSGFLGVPASPSVYDANLQNILDGRELFIDKNLKTSNYVSKQLDIPFLFMEQAHLWLNPSLPNDEQYSQREPTNEELEVMGNIAITYGAKGITYFAYDSWGEFAPDPNTGKYAYGRGLLEHPATYPNPDTSKRYLNVYGQKKWDKICEINHRLKKWEPCIMSFDIQNTNSYAFHNETERNNLLSESYFFDVVTYKPGVGLPPCVEDNPGGDSPSGLIYECRYDRYLQVATFKTNSDDGNKYFMIVNRRCSPFLDETTEDRRGGKRFLQVRFDSNSTEFANYNNWKITALDSNKTVAVFDKSAGALIDLGWYMPGQGILYKISPVVIEGGELTADENISTGFTSNGMIYGNGHNISISPNTTITFSENAGIEMNGGSFICGENSDNADAVTLTGKTESVFWNGITLTGCDSVGVYNTNISNIKANDTAKAYLIINSYKVNFRRNTITANSNSGGIQAVYNNNSDDTIVFNIRECTFNMNQSGYSAISIFSNASVTLPLITEWCIFNTGNDTSNAIMLTEVTGGVIKNNTFSNFGNTVVLMYSAIDLYGNLILGGNNSQGIQCLSGSNVSLSPVSGLYLGGYNYIKNYGTSSCNIYSNNSLFNIHNGQNNFDIDDIDNSKHLTGNFSGIPLQYVNAVKNCFHRDSITNIDAIHSVVWYDTTLVNFIFTDYSCELSPPGDYLVYQYNGYNDTVYNRSGGEGSGFIFRNALKTEENAYKSIKDTININLRKRNYSIVEDKAKQLLTMYSDSLESSGTVQKLYIASYNLDSGGSNIGTTKTFLENLIISNPQNSALLKRAFYFIQKCKVKLGQYQSALDGFQYIMTQNPYTYEGLVASWDYAATYLLMGTGGSNKGDFKQTLEELDTPLDTLLNRMTKRDINTNKGINTSSNEQIIKTFYEKVKNATKDDKTIQEEKIKSLEKKIKTSKTKTERSEATKELETMKQIKEAVKIKKPDNVMTHTAIMNNDIKKVFGIGKNKMDETSNNLVPETYTLYQNYPNPFNPVTKISFALPKESRVKLIIYDMLGREVAKIINNENLSAGTYIREFNGSNLASGVYFLRILVNDGKDFSDVKKIVLLK